jgi:ufm1-conjugating enzyme 1
LSKYFLIYRLKEEYFSLIKYVENNKEADNDWFRLESNGDGTKWWGKCWHVHELLKYEFTLEFDIPITYPTTPPGIFQKRANFYLKLLF